MTKSMIDRFWEKINKHESDGCWEWIGSRSQSGNGYGQFWLEGKIQPAHRIAWQIEKGSIPEGMEICHTCDNRACVRVSHMFLGTRSDNMKDAAQKGRNGMQIYPERSSFLRPNRPTPRGEQQGNSKLTDEQVREIRQLADAGASPRQLAARFNISKTNAWQIKAKKTWRHVL